MTVGARLRGWAAGLLAGMLASACATTVSVPEPADVDFVIGAYARAAQGYERLLVLQPGHADRDRIRFRLALSYLLAGPHGRDVARASEVLESLAGDRDAAPELRAAARLLLATEAERVRLANELEEQLAATARAATACAEDLGCAHTAWLACTEAKDQATARARASAAVSEREIARLEQELARLAATLERFTEIDTNPDGDAP